jgi:hypothetical protein
LRRGVDELRMALGQRVVPMAPKRRPSICDPRSELIVGAADVLPKVVLRKAGPLSRLGVRGRRYERCPRRRRPSRWRASAFAVACRSHTSASETSALPSEALFAARGALFEPILVTRAGEHARQIQRGGNKLESAFEEQA